MQNDSSYVRSWAEAKREELKHSNEINPENLFAGMVYGLAAFAKDDPRRKKIEGFADVAKHYSNDSSLFEVGCYLYFRIDMWLFQNKPNLREKLSRIFVREFNKLFEQALGINNLPNLFSERVSKYGELARKGEKLERYHFYLSQLILLAKDNTPPQKYDFDKAPLIIGDVFGDISIKIALASWDKALIPAIIKSVEKCCDIMEKDIRAL